jgi:hypothetical protein
MNSVSHQIFRYICNLSKQEIQMIKGLIGILIRFNYLLLVSKHGPLIPSPLPLRVAKTGRNHLNEKFTPLLPTGIGERF